MDKYCKFKESLYDGSELIWKKDEEYKVIFENESNYYFGDPLKNGIDKKLEGQKYIVIEKPIQ